jgi:hypothetical protein
MRSEARRHVVVFGTVPPGTTNMSDDDHCLRCGSGLHSLRSI